MISITIDGDRLIAQELARLPRRALEELDDATDTVAGEELRDLATYPSAPAGSTYQRTGDLGRGWAQAQPRVTFGAGGFTKVFTNAVDYATYVQGEDQAWMHEGRWDTAEAVHDRYQEQYEHAGQQAIDRLRVEGA